MRLGGVDSATTLHSSAEPLHVDISAKYTELSRALTNAGNTRLSEHKALVFGLAAALLAVKRRCALVRPELGIPTDLDPAGAYRRLRRISALFYSLALASFALGVVFASHCRLWHLSADAMAPLADCLSRIPLGVRWVGVSVFSRSSRGQRSGKWNAAPRGVGRIL